MYLGLFKKNDEDTNRYYVVQFRSKLYIFQDDKYMKSNKPPIKPFPGEIVWNAIFLIPVHNTKY